jgi:hypothetical protein
MSWLGAQLAPLVLLPLAAVLLWVAIAKVWLPAPDGPGPSQHSVTTVERNTATTPTVTTTTVTKTSDDAPSRRSETLAITLLLLGCGIAVAGLFARRLGSIDLGPDGVKVTLTPPEKKALASLIDTLGNRGADSETVATGIERYLGAVAGGKRHVLSAKPEPTSVAGAIADGLIPP